MIIVDNTRTIVDIICGAEMTWSDTNTNITSKNKAIIKHSNVT